MDTIPLQALEFSAGHCEAVQVQSLDARGTGKILLLNRKGEVIKYYDPSTTTIFITTNDKGSNKGS